MKRNHLSHNEQGCPCCCQTVLNSKLANSALLTGLIDPNIKGENSSLALALGMIEAIVFTRYEQACRYTTFCIYRPAVWQHNLKPRTIAQTTNAHCYSFRNDARYSSDVAHLLSDCSLASASRRWKLCSCFANPAFCRMRKMPNQTKRADR